MTLSDSSVLPDDLEGDDAVPYIDERLVPSLAWVTFAAVLNVELRRLNA